MEFTHVDFLNCLERLKNIKPAKDWLYISSSMLADVKAGKLDGETLVFSNGCVFLGKTLRELLEDEEKIRHAQKQERPDVRA